MEEAVEGVVHLVLLVVGVPAWLWNSHDDREEPAVKKGCLRPGHRRIYTEEKTKVVLGRRCCLKDIIASIPCRASYFAPG